VGGAATTGAVVAGDPRTAGTLVEDQAIEMRAAAALRADEALREQTHVSITSYNEVVLLTARHRVARCANAPSRWSVKSTRFATSTTKSPSVRRVRCSRAPMTAC